MSAVLDGLFEAGLEVGAGALFAGDIVAGAVPVAVLWGLATARL